MAANPYLDETVNNTLGDMTRSWNMTQQPAYDAAMLRSGSFGNSGVQQMNQEGQRQFQNSLGRAASDLRYNDYWNDQNFNRNIFNDAYAQNMGNMQAGMGLMQYLNSSNQQDLTNATNAQNTPLNYWQNFTNSANGVGQGYGTSTGSVQMPGSPMMGALGGAQLGNAAAQAFGWGNNSMGNSVYNPRTNMGGWGSSSSSPLGSFFYGNGGSGD